MENLLQIAKNLINSIHALKTQEKDLDQHYENIIISLKSNLPLKTDQYQSILLILIKKIQKQSQEYDEFYIQQILKILQNIPKQQYFEQLQLTIAILSSLINILQIVNQSLILEIFHIFLIISENNQVLKIAYPQIFIKVLSQLLKYNKTQIQEVGLKLMQVVIDYILSNTDFKVQSENFNLATLQQQQNITHIAQQKVNEELTNFCQLITHQPTPKLTQCYTSFILAIFNNNNSGKYFYITTQIALINLFFRFNDGLEIEKFSDLIFQRNQFQLIKIQNELEEELEFELKRFHKFQHEINSTQTIASIRKIKWLILIIQSNQENQLHSNQLNEKIIKSLQQGLQYKWNQIIVSIDSSINPITKGKELKASFEQSLNKLNLEYIPFFNNEQFILKEINQLLMILKNNKFINELLLEKIDKRINKLVQQIIFDESKIITIQINSILEISSILFIYNSIGFEFKQSKQFLKQIIQNIYLLIFNQNIPYNIIFQIQLIIFCCSIQNNLEDKNDIFIQVQYLDYLICQNSQQLPLIEELTSIELQKTNIYDHVASILYRNIVKIQESNLQVDQGNALQTILHIYSKFDGFNQGLDIIYQVLKTIYQIYDKYYLKSDLLFTQKYLQFLIMFFKQWDNPKLNNNLVTIIRQIILSITQFFHNQQLQYFAFQCFYHCIPILAKQELKECTSQQIFGMNDDNNVKVVDTLGTIFFEQKRSFEQVLIQQNLIAKFYVWKIIKELYVNQCCTGFFQLKCIQQFLNYFLIIEKEENNNSIKIYIQIIEFLNLYCTQNINNPNIKELIQQIDLFLKKCKQINSQQLQQLIIEFNEKFKQT